ncbi:acetyltransferase [Vibrio anguillarum]|nr:acetyltransferase [Vibrio anguillarum]
MFTVCFLSSAVRCQPLSRALTLFWVYINKFNRLNDFDNWLSLC